MMMQLLRRISSALHVIPGYRFIPGFLRIVPLLFSERRDPDLRQILRSYLGWIPMSPFSEPRRWLGQIARSRQRFRQDLQRPESLYAPHLEPDPFPPPDGVSRLLEASCDAVKAEFERVQHVQVNSPSERLVEKGAWTTFPLQLSGHRIEENIACCPTTWAVVERCPVIAGRSAVYFSIMHPGTHVRPHCGPSNLRRRYHLGIEEADGARIRLGREWRTWRQGECLVLDDSVEHEVVHTGDKRRVVLIVDCWHPDLSEKERLFLTRLCEIWRPAF